MIPSTGDGRLSQLRSQLSVQAQSVRNLIPESLNIGGRRPGVGDASTFTWAMAQALQVMAAAFLANSPQAAAGLSILGNIFGTAVDAGTFYSKRTEIKELQDKFIDIIKGVDIADIESIKVRKSLTGSLEDLTYGTDITDAWVDCAEMQIKLRRLTDIVKIHNVSNFAAKYAFAQATSVATSLALLSANIWSTYTNLYTGLPQQTSANVTMPDNIDHIINVINSICSDNLAHNFTSQDLQALFNLSSGFNNSVSQSNGITAANIIAGMGTIPFMTSVNWIVTALLNQEKQIGAASKFIYDKLTVDGDTEQIKKLADVLTGLKIMPASGFIKTNVIDGSSQNDSRNSPRADNDEESMHTAPSSNSDSEQVDQQAALAADRLVHGLTPNSADEQFRSSQIEQDLAVKIGNSSMTTNEKKAARAVLHDFCIVTEKVISEASRVLSAEDSQNLIDKLKAVATELSFQKAGMTQSSTTAVSFSDHQHIARPVQYSNAAQPAPVFSNQGASFVKKKR